MRFVLGGAIRTEGGTRRRTAFLGLVSLVIAACEDAAGPKSTVSLGQEPEAGLGTLAVPCTAGCVLPPTVFARRDGQTAPDLREFAGDPGARYVLIVQDDGREGTAAEIKLQHFEIWDFFEWGAFSDDAADRNALVPIARSRAETYDIPAEAIERVIVIGDTPHDIECARVSGARSIAVATGGYSIEQLRHAGADEVLEDLSDTERVLSLLL